MEKLIGGGKTIIDSIDVGLSYRIFFVLDNHRFYRCWFVLQDFLRTLYSPHLHAYETDCNELNVKHELELERPQFSYLVTECKKILTGVGKF